MCGNWCRAPEPECVPKRVRVCTRGSSFFFFAPVCVLCVRARALCRFVCECAESCTPVDARGARRVLSHVNVHTCTRSCSRSHRLAPIIFPVWMLLLFCSVLPFSHVVRVQTSPASCAHDCKRTSSFTGFDQPTPHSMMWSVAVLPVCFLLPRRRRRWSRRSVGVAHMRLFRFTPCSLFVCLFVFRFTFCFLCSARVRRGVLCFDTLFPRSLLPSSCPHIRTAHLSPPFPPLSPLSCEGNVELPILPLRLSLSVFCFDLFLLCQLLSSGFLSPGTRIILSLPCIPVSARVEVHVCVCVCVSVRKRGGDSALLSK